MISVSPADESQLSDQFSDASKQLLNELHFAADLSETNPVEATHQTRKLLKRFRSMAKLLRFCGNEMLYRNINTKFRDWGRNFSSLRDVHVRALLLSEFSVDETSGNHAEILSRLINVNCRQLEETERDFLTQRKIFQKVLREINRNDVIKLFFEEIRPNFACMQQGMEKSYNDSYQAFISAKEGDKPGLYHEWRKRSKDVQYQFELLIDEPMSEKSDPLQKIVGICDLLGREHDLFMLMEWISNLKTNRLPRDQIDLLYQNLHEMKKNHQRTVEQAGMDFYNSNPDGFSGSVIFELRHG